MFPFHTGFARIAMPDAPTAGSVILASVLLKMGTYGFLQLLSLPLLARHFKEPTRLVTVGRRSLHQYRRHLWRLKPALVQKDWKSSGVLHAVSWCLGFCTLGIFALNPEGIQGSILQQINHGISTGMLFLIVGVVYERRHTREIKEYGGLIRVMPVFTIVFLIAALSSMGMPPLNGFIGEITILQGAYQMSLNWAFWGVLGIALGAAYLLWLFQRTMLGEISEKNRSFEDLTVARDRGLRTADRVGILDRVISRAIFQSARAASGADCGACAAGVLCGASFGESAEWWGGGEAIEEDPGRAVKDAED